MRDGRPVYVDELGPAMLELDERARKFVLAYCAYPQASGTELAKMAGYKQGERSQGWRSQASRLLRRPGIIAAIHECLTKTYRGRGAAIAQDVMLQIAQNPLHPQQLKAALALADRGGFGAMMESKLTVEHKDLTSDALIEKIMRLAKMLGPDVAAAMTRRLGGEVIDADGVPALEQGRPRLDGGDQGDRDQTDRRD